MALTDRERELAERSRRLLKVELKRAGLGYRELAERLNEYGLDETESSITSKLARGTFAATFFIAVLTVLGLEGIRLEAFRNRSR